LKTLMPIMISRGTRSCRLRSRQILISRIYKLESKRCL
jgi:hypothetical protein